MREINNYLKKRKKNFYSWFYYVLTCKNNDKNKTIDVAKKRH